MPRLLSLTGSKRQGDGGGWKLIVIEISNGSLKPSEFNSMRTAIVSWERICTQCRMSWQQWLTPMPFSVDHRAQRRMVYRRSPEHGFLHLYRWHRGEGHSTLLRLNPES